MCGGESDPRGVKVACPTGLTLKSLTLGMFICFRRWMNKLGLSAITHDASGVRTAAGYYRPDSPPHQVLLNSEYLRIIIMSVYFCCRVVMQSISSWKVICTEGYLSLKVLSTVHYNSAENILIHCIKFCGKFKTCICIIDMGILKESFLVSKSEISFTHIYLK